MPPRRPGFHSRGVRRTSSDEIDTIDEILLEWSRRRRPANRDYYLGGTQVAFDLLETMRRQLSVELGPHGIRIVTLESGGVAESLPEGFDGRQEIVDLIEGQTLLGRTATLEEIGNVVAFVASDKAGPMTAATVNTSAGALVD
jgi:3-oxoacyl-[acyl-carrier protein] reductase